MLSDQLDEALGSRHPPAHQSFVGTITLRPACEVIVENDRRLEKELTGEVLKGGH
jgi:hypothetical protein